MLLFLLSHPTTGRSHETRSEGGVGCGACARGSQPPLPGGTGAPPGGIMTPCQELADGEPKGSPKARPGAEGERRKISPDGEKLVRVARREAPALR